MKVYVAGHRGMVGSAIVRALRARGYADIVTRTHAELDLADQQAVRAFFAKEKPGHVVLAAAKVGGIHANNTYPAEFIYENLMMEANVVHEAYRAGVKKLLFLGSSCIYPVRAAQPMREDALLTGTLEPTNEPYAIQDRGHQALRVVQPPVRRGLPQRDAHEPVRPRRQLPPGE